VVVLLLATLATGAVVATGVLLQAPSRARTAAKLQILVKLTLKSPVGIEGAKPQRRAGAVTIWSAPL
jgi:hypothetical protein